MVDVKAQSFRSIEDGRSKGPIIYSLEGDTPDETKWFRIDPSTGIVHLTRQLDYDDQSLPKQHQLKVTAREDNRESHVALTIRIDDVNDNAPMFTRPLYTAQVREDIPLNQTILKGKGWRVVGAISDFLVFDSLGKLFRDTVAPIVGKHQTLRRQNAQN